MTVGRRRIVSSVVEKMTGIDYGRFLIASIPYTTLTSAQQHASGLGWPTGGSCGQCYVLVDGMICALIWESEYSRVK